MDLEKEFLNITYHELTLNWNDIFPQVNADVVQNEFAHLICENDHDTVFNVAKELWNGGYEWIFKNCGFWDPAFGVFSGHCHQCTPALGLVLHVFGFSVSYLECHRIRAHVIETGILEQVPPKEETDPAMLKEFCAINRIPYCCLEVIIDNRTFFITGKHLKPETNFPNKTGITTSGKNAKALLMPVCYSDLTGVFCHQDDSLKSGIYLQQVIPKQNPNNIDWNKQVVWMKQTPKDLSPEFFVTFLRMNFKNS